MGESTEPLPNPVETALQKSDELIWARRLVEYGSVELNNVWNTCRLLEKIKNDVYSSEVLLGLEHIEQARQEFLKTYQEDLLWTLHELEGIIASSPGKLANRSGQVVSGVELVEEDGRQVLHFLFDGPAE